MSYPHLNGFSETFCEIKKCKQASHSQVTEETHKEFNLLACNEKVKLVYGSNSFSKWVSCMGLSTAVFKAFQILPGWGGGDGGRWFFRQAVKNSPFRECIFHWFYPQSSIMWNWGSKQKLSQRAPPKNQGSLEPHFQVHNWLKCLEVQVSLKTSGVEALFCFNLSRS